MLFLNAVSRAGDGFPSNASSFRHARIAAMTPSVRFRQGGIPGFPHALGGRRPRHPRPHRCQVRIRDAEVIPLLKIVTPV